MSQTAPLPGFPGLPGYAELQCLSCFSFLRGASTPEELVDRASEAGYASLALTDECSLAGVVRARQQIRKWDAAIKNGETTSRASPLHLIIGSQFRIETPAGDSLTLVALARNKEGYGNLSELITLGRTREGSGKHSYRLLRDDLACPTGELAHLRGLPDCLLLLVPDYGMPADVLAEQARWLAQTFPGRAWIALTQLMRAQDIRHGRMVQQVAQAAGLPVVATGQVEMHARTRKSLHDTLCAIRLRKTVHDCGYALAPNAEQHLRARVQLANLYPAQALAESLRIAALCTFSLDELRYEYPDEIVPSGHTPASYLRSETYAGAQRRFPGGLPAEVAKQIETELALIEELRYEAYFLTVYDIVKFANDHGILCQGRGSAANSAVCYCLGITAVNPQDHTLLFGRFISKERNEPPDIDVDFEHQRREEVIQYIYKKYGRGRSALTAVVISYRMRSVLRDTGKALGVSTDLVDRVAKAHQWWDGRDGLLGRFASCGLDPESALAGRWARLAESLLDFPRHLSQHPGGFVIARGKLSRLVPIENAAMPDRSVVQWDKDDLDSVGLLKVDVLALGMLTVLRKGLALASQRSGKPMTLYGIKPGDPDTYDMICKADTIGTFQIESRAQMSMLPRLKPRDLYDLTVQVAIVRPGPIQGGMVHPYLLNREKRAKGEPIDFPYPRLHKALGRTLGVPIFQEQVMQIAIDGAGFSQGEADELRRAMAAWRRKGDIEKYQQKLRDGMLKNDYDLAFADALFEQIKGFGEYGFPESHAASFAYLAYVSAWLKCHEPEAFLAALLNSQPMGFYPPYQLIQDARRKGVEVLPVDVCVSDWEATLEATGREKPAVRLGLNRIQGLAEADALRIAAACKERPFSDTTDLGRRAGLNRHALQALAAADALRTLAGHRRTALWEAIDSVPERGLLREASVHEPAPELPAPSEADDIVADYNALRLTLKRHPVALLREGLSRRGFMQANVLKDYPGGRLARACGIVTVRQRPGTANGTIFVTLEDETGHVNVILWPALVEAQRKELLGSSLLGVYGIWQSHSGVHHLLAKRLVDLSPLLGRLATHSRNFH